MQKYTFDFASKDEMTEVAKRLWDQLKVSGEMSANALPGGHWRLELNSEKEIREAALEKFKPWRVEPGND